MLASLALAFGKSNGLISISTRFCRLTPTLNTSMAHRRHVITIASLACLLAPALLSQEALARNPTTSKDLAVARRFADRISIAFEQGDVEKFNEAIDWRGIFDEAVADIRLPSNKFREDMWSGTEQSLNAPNGLARQIVGQSKTGGSYTLLRVRGTAAKPRALFRFIDGNGLINYHEFLCVEKSGEVVARDFYIFAAGERISSTFNRSFSIALSDIDSGWLKQIFGGAVPGTAAKQYQEFVAIALAGDHAKTAEAYEALPEPFKQDKALGIIYIKSAMSTGDEAIYLEALEELEERHAGDAMLDLILIDATLLRGEYDEHFAAIARLQKALGGDPYLDFLTASGLASSGKPQEALRLANQVKPELVGIQVVDMALIDIQLEAEAWDEVAESLERTQQEYGVAWPDLREHDGFQGFVESPAGKKWLIEKDYVK